MSDLTLKIGDYGIGEDLFRVSNIGLDKHFFQHKIVNIFLPISFSMCFGCSKEPSH